MLRYSLFSLLAAVLVISLGCAALVNASELWANLLATLTILVLLVAIVAACYLPGKARAFAGGFAIFGWAYLLLVQGSWFEHMRPRLLTTVAVDWLETALQDKSYDEQTSFPVLDAWTGPVNVKEIWLPRWRVDPYVDSGLVVWWGTQIGHSLWTILLACLGGVLARWFDRRSQIARQEAEGVRKT